jgi:hypothetical protein
MLFINVGDNYRLFLFTSVTHVSHVFFERVNLARVISVPGEK